MTHTQPSPGMNASQVDIDERPAWYVNGAIGVVLLLLTIAIAVAAIITAALNAESNLPLTVGFGVLGGLAVIASLIVGGSLAMIQPGQTRVVQFFGAYVGTVRRTGLVWLRPLTLRRSVSVRVRNFETSLLKVNDLGGNPVDVAAIVVWQVADTAKALFAVDSYTQFIATQSEAALRHVAQSYPYDGPDGVLTLRGSTDEVAAQLADEVAARITVAGVEVLEVRISHLAYSSEIAQAMLQRQQAAAVVAARTLIVDGAVGMVEMALTKLNERGIVELDEERKAAMVSNLLVVLCGDSRVSPVVNTGSLY